MPLATPTEACREYARNVGMDDPSREWICTHFDTWERNPFYTGVKHVDPETAGDMLWDRENLTSEEREFLTRVRAYDTTTPVEFDNPF